jgi:CDP-diacylglycerol--serine O-phosphatidyltransferase
MIRHIPNFITSLNLLSGSIALVFAFDGMLWMASLLIGLGALFDFLDGLAARLLRVSNGIGKELDSLADVITFGLAPGVILFQLMDQDLGLSGWRIFNHSGMAFIAFLIPVFAALRLAKFNIDTRQEEVFYGLPTPAAAIFVGSLPLVLNQDGLPFGMAIGGLHSLLMNFFFLASLTILISWLMVSDIRLLSLKFKTYGWNENRLRYVFLILALAFLLLFGYAGIPMSIVLYIAVSLFSKGYF